MTREEELEKLVVKLTAERDDLQRRLNTAIQIIAEVDKGLGQALERLRATEDVGG